MRVNRAIIAYQRTVLHWYRRHGRRLPWRGIRDPYRILISEIMLQQTQVSRVLRKYPIFLKAFPTIHALAGAQRAAVIRGWQGMGYNNRAVRLHLLAQTVVDRHNGKLPQDYEALVVLPGIGKYTAHAILSSAFVQAVPVVDINVRRLFSRLFWPMPSERLMRPEKEIWPLAAALLPRRSAYDWNQALMDLGATICTARSPHCMECPVARFCKSRKRMQSPQLRSSPSRASSPEPSYRGVPVRIHRGKIVEALRNVQEGRQIAFKTLAAKLFRDPTSADELWIAKTLAALEKDGLVRVGRRGIALR